MLELLDGKGVSSKPRFGKGIDRGLVVYGSLQIECFHVFEKKIREGIFVSFKYICI